MNLRLIDFNESGDREVMPIQDGLLGYASLNEVNYTAFGEATEEYHDELFGFIEEQEWMDEYEKGQPQRPYVFSRKGVTKNQQRTLTRYIRDVQHHPDNTCNPKYTEQELEQSIADMRDFLSGKSFPARTTPGTNL